MITAKFVKSPQGFVSFRVSGHAGYAEAGADIVCASVSSAVMLTVNGITECAHLPAAVSVHGDEISCELPESGGAGSLFLQALWLHLTSLKEEYPEYIQVTVADHTDTYGGAFTC